ncbi:MAG: GAF domain-containing protein [Gemmatimonadota bacterium]
MGLGGAVVARLESLREREAGRDEMLQEAVRAIKELGETYDWVGIYLLEGDTLVLHNYVGAATDHERIAVGVGVCGSAVAEERNIVVDDVLALDNYLACSLDTRSEIVVLIRDEAGTIFGQLDLDSDTPGAFGPADEAELQIVADWLVPLFRPQADIAGAR